jgi:cytochrome P450
VVETIRRHPVSSLSRYLAEPVEYSAGGRRYRIPAGCYLATSPHELSHDPAVYAAPDDYDPFRWRRGEPVPPLFGRGFFGCVATRFSRAVLVAVLGALLDRYDIILRGRPRRRRVRMHLLYPSGRLRARLVPRVEGTTI